MKTPYVRKQGKFWVMRFRMSVNEGGEIKKVQKAQQIAPATISKNEARKIASEKLKELSKSLPAKPELVVTLGDFVTRVYLPFVEAHKRTATAEGYAQMWKSHCAGRANIAGKLLSSVKTSDVYTWLAEISATDRNRNGEPLRRNTLHHIKSFLSGVFALAICHDYYSQEKNPVNGAIMPEAPEAAETYAYSLEEIAAMLSVLPEPARTMVATAAFTGLRRSELRGLVWEGYSEGSLSVMHSIVEGEIQEPKTRASKAAVPLLPSLSRVLDVHRQRDGEPVSGPIFRTSIGTSLDPNNVLGRQILPALNRCATCHKTEPEHTAKVTHDYQRNESLPRWNGWHAFRRGLATNLYRLGVSDKTVQAILRHSNVATTQTYYIKSMAEDSVRAMKALDSVLCLNRALESTDTARMLTQ